MYQLHDNARFLPTKIHQTPYIVIDKPGKYKAHEVLDINNSGVVSVRESKAHINNKDSEAHACSKNIPTQAQLPGLLGLTHVNCESKAQLQNFLYYTRIPNGKPSQTKSESTPSKRRKGYSNIFKLKRPK